MAYLIEINDIRYNCFALNWK